jgi:hypothetical protein
MITFSRSVNGATAATIDTRSASSAIDAASSDSVVPVEIPASVQMGPVTVEARL